MKKQLGASGFAMDEAGKADDVSNKGYIERRGWTIAGASKTFYSKLFVDLFQQPKYMIGNVSMRIKLVKANYEAALWTNITGEKPKFAIESAKLYLRKIRPHPKILMDVESNLARGGMVHYPINRTEIVTIYAPVNILELSKEQLFYGRIPKIIVMAMVDSEAISGMYNKNPYNFKSSNVKYIDLRIDGVSKPILPLTPNFKTKMCTREYMNLLEAMGILGKDAYLPFCYEDFLNGYTFFAWNLTADYQGQRQVSGRRANIRLDLKFEDALARAMNILLYCVFDSTVSIDGSGNVFTDYKD